MDISSTTILDALAIFSVQFLFQYLRAISTRSVIAKHIRWAVTSSTVLQGLWLVGTYLGVMAVHEMNWLAITGYMLGGALGTYYSFKVLKHI